MSFAAPDLPPDPSAPARVIGPGPVPLHATDRRAALTVGRFTTTPPPRPLPGEAEEATEAVELARFCRASAARMFERRASPTADHLGEVSAAAARWAREGVLIGTVLRAFHEGLRAAFDAVTTGAADRKEVLGATGLLLELLRAITAAVCDAYLDEQQLLAREHQAAAQTLASALLGGHAGSAVARHSGLPIADSYQVVALAAPAHPDETTDRLDAQIAARRKLRRVQSALAAVFGAQALALLSPTGGTLLLPRGIARGELTAELLAELSATAEVSLIATAVTADAEQVPEAAEQAHELLELVRVAGRAPGFYVLADLAMEYQLTRQGPANRQLASLLDPLDAYPELFDTLRAYLRNDMNRRLSARQLFVHPNTVDYRLRRIVQLTGLDLATSAGIAQATTALLARELQQVGPGRR